MTRSPNLFRAALAAAILLPLAGPAAAATRPIQKARPRAAAPRPVTADNSVIQLPLNPVVPPAQRLCAARTPTGLGYATLRPATGARPAAGATVLVNYIGYLAATGAVFDQGMRSPLTVDGVIPGFGEGLQMLARTGVVRLCIPAALGYGAQASGPIPANANLVFQVELLDFRTATEMDAMRSASGADPAPKTDTPPQP